MYMPRLVKGAKWVYGWVVIGPHGEVAIPPQAWCEFGFRQLLLFASFLASMLLYLRTENLILVALIHNVGGSVGLAVNGTVFDQPHDLLIITAVIMAGLFAYVIVYEIRHRGRPYRAGWWLQVEIDAGGPRT
jgi:hypothetical protein